MSDFLKKDISEIEKLVSPFTKIDFDLSEDINDPIMTSNRGVIDGKYAVIGNIYLSGNLKSIDTLNNAKNKGYYSSPLENIYDSFMKELKLGGIKNYEDFEAIMITDQSILKELNIEPWVISQVMELYNNIEQKSNNWISINVDICIPIKDYNNVFGWNFDFDNYDEEDLISQFNDCDCYGCCVIDAGYDKANDDYGFYYDEKPFIEKIGTVKNHSVKNLVKDVLNYYNLK